MGVYEILFRFADTQLDFGDEGTRPWAQGFPMTRQVPGGPPMPTTVTLGSADLRYPQATGNTELREAIAAYYQRTYDAPIDAENVAVFAGGRPGVWAILSFLESDVTVQIEEAEYTPYWDALEVLGRAYGIVSSNPANRFRPSLAEHTAAADSAPRSFLIKSNPNNPTGVTVRGEELKALVDLYAKPGRGALFDEAYEFFHEAPDSALRYVDTLEGTDMFVVGAATKGLQAPGARVGWVIASREHAELFRNFSSIAMGGVSRPSQLLVTELLEPLRAEHARKAIGAFYETQRERYGELLAKDGVELVIGDGGFYHWGTLLGGMTADDFNEHLFKENAAILPGRLCDMHRRRGADAPHERYLCFSFGPMGPNDFAEDAAILERVFGRLG